MDQVVLTLDQIKSLAVKFILESLVLNCRSIREKWREKWSDKVVGYSGSWWSWGRWWHCWLITVVRCIFAILPIRCILLLFIVCLCITQQKIKFQLNSNENIFLNESIIIYAISKEREIPRGIQNAHKKDRFARQSNYWFLCLKIKLTSNRNLKWQF